jgi:DNA-binding NarL/FixJ family response regulator
MPGVFLHILGLAAARSAPMHYGTRAAWAYAERRMQTPRAGAVARGLRVLVVVRDARLGAAIGATLRQHGAEVVACASVAALGAAVSHQPREVGLLDWSMADGLLTEEHRGDLHHLGRLVPIVLLVPSRWARLLSAEEFGVARVLPKSSGADALLEALISAAPSEDVTDRP